MQGTRFPIQIWNQEMNKRIKELMNEAFSDIMGVDQLEDRHFEKFANLIILD